MAVIVISVSIPLMLADDSTGDGFTLAQSLAFVVLGVAWDVVCTMRFGGTPMKRAFGMRVVRSDSDGPLEWSHAIKRWALPGAFALLPIPVISNLAIFGVWIVGLVFLFAKPLRQTVSDQFAKTVVVKSR